MFTQARLLSTDTSLSGRDRPDSATPVRPSHSGSIPVCPSHSGSIPKFRSVRVTQARIPVRPDSGVRLTRIWALGTRGSESAPGRGRCNRKRFSQTSLSQTILDRPKASDGRDPDGGFRESLRHSEEVEGKVGDVGRFERISAPLQGDPIGLIRARLGSRGLRESLRHSEEAQEEAPQKRCSA